MRMTMTLKLSEEELKEAEVVKEKLEEWGLSLEGHKLIGLPEDVEAASYEFPFISKRYNTQDYII